MYRSASTLTTLAVTLSLSACVSAGERLEQGMEAEASGRWYGAANRYIETLEKDAGMEEARTRLMVVGDSAIRQSLREVEDWLSSGNAVDAGEEYHRVDGLLSRAGRVGVRLPTPRTYTETRRSAFDAAIHELMDLSERARTQRDWQTGRRALNRVRSDFEPSDRQRRESLREESRLLLDWALASEAAHHPRQAHGLAGEALAIPQAPPDVAEAAAALQHRAVASGTMALVVFPVGARPEVQDRSEADLARLLSDALELDHWRNPPLFVSVADPLIVRAMTRRINPAGTLFRPERVMDELEADFGVLIDIDSMAVAEERVRRQTRTTETRRGGEATYSREEGTLAYEVQARVLLLDGEGRELEDFMVGHRESGPFERGIYDQDPRSLRLSRTEARLFDPIVLAQQRAGIEDALMTQLARRIADQVFQSVLRRIP